MELVAIAENELIAFIPINSPQGDGNLVLSDRLLINDELHHLWSLFKRGVRILMILDCCHSGGFDVPEPKTSSCLVIIASEILLASCAYL